MSTQREEHNKILNKFDASDYLTDEESIAEYLNAAMEAGDQALLMAAIADVAKAIGMQAIFVHHSTRGHKRHRGHRGFF